MVKFQEVDLDEIPNHREGRRGRVSYPILKAFLEQDKFCLMLDRTGMQQSFQSLYSCLTSYIRSHDLPVKLFSRQNQLYLMRLDMQEDGTPIEDWKNFQGLKTTEGHAATEADMEPRPIDSAEVASRFEEERDKVTK